MSTERPRFATLTLTNGHPVSVNPDYVVTVYEQTSDEMCEVVLNGAPSLIVKGKREAIVAALANEPG